MPRCLKLSHFLFQRWKLLPFFHACSHTHPKSDLSHIIKCLLVNMLCRIIIHRLNEAKKKRKIQIFNWCIVWASKQLQQEKHRHLTLLIFLLSLSIFLLIFKSNALAHLFPSQALMCVFSFILSGYRIYDVGNINIFRVWHR